MATLLEAWCSRIMSPIFRCSRTNVDKTDTTRTPDLYLSFCDGFVEERAAVSSGLRGCNTELVANFFLCTVRAF